ncbi:hypothetical protein SAY87_001663 [Trapa incisa]|uniref:Uncharacterized protein n=1 Tax=Trapa incisa TaxID=236973 RepID=A0AAN7PTI7_9MYRT|nr:hypothetical protein SAY87_001663 [Trapa incisa]
MGTEVQFESYMPGYCSMRDLNEDMRIYNHWPLHYRDRPFPNGQLYDRSQPSSTADFCIGYDKVSVKKKMLEHEAIFKNQVYELHRLYRIQKDLMDEIKRKELPSSTLASQSFLPEDAWKWQSPCFLFNCGRPSFSASEASSSLMKSMTGCNSPQTSLFQPQKQDGSSSKIPEWFESRSSKVRRRMFDLTLPAEKYIDTVESEPFNSETYYRAGKAVTDLNQPIHTEDTDIPVHYQGNTLFNGKILSRDLPSKSGCGTSDRALRNWHTENNGDSRGWLSHIVTAGHDNDDPRHALDQHEFSRTFDWANSNRCLHSARERHGGNLNQKSISLENGSFPQSYPAHYRNFHSPVLDLGTGKMWHLRGGRPDSVSESKPPLDGIVFLPGSSLKPKATPNRSHDQGSIDIKPSPAMDLNKVLSDGEELQDDHLAVVPWLKVKRCQMDDVPNTCSTLKEKSPYQSLDTQLAHRPILGECSSTTKTGQISIFREPPVYKKEFSFPRKSDTDFAVGRNMRVFDINLPCEQIPELSNLVPDAPLVLESKELSTRGSGLKCEIDLNSYADEDETFLSTADGASGRGNSVIIDLETPACPEMDEISSEDEANIQSSHGEMDHLPEETKIAAEAIVAISSVVLDLPQPSAENLKWFASLVLKEMQVRDLYSPLEEIDYFESMTLRLTEMKDEEHLPHPLVPPETMKSTVAKSAANHRPQRRGRQKRDFQRDILPGLNSLSRHEVTEDMQTFCGIMRAMGQTWNSGPTRSKSARNRSARPRKKITGTGCASPPVLVTSYIPPVSLTGWGTTRRPRRQRCPAPQGNNPLIQLT